MAIKNPWIVLKHDYGFFRLKKDSIAAVYTDRSTRSVTITHHQGNKTTLYLRHALPSSSNAYLKVCKQLGLK